MPSPTARLRRTRANAQGRDGGRPRPPRPARPTSQPEETPSKTGEEDHRPDHRPPGTGSSWGGRATRRDPGVDGCPPRGDKGRRGSGDVDPGGVRHDHANPLEPGRDPDEVERVAAGPRHVHQRIVDDPGRRLEGVRREPAGDLREDDNRRGAVPELFRARPPA